MRLRRVRILQFMLVAAVAVTGAPGCGSTQTQQQQPAAVTRPNLEPRWSTLDTKAVRPQSVVAEAMVAVYAIDDNEGRTFDEMLSQKAGEDLNALVRARSDDRMLDVAAVNGTPLIAAEFYNRMDKATSYVIDYCLRNEVCTARPLAFDLPVSHKLTAWREALGVRYVVFLRVLGAHRPTGFSSAGMGGVAFGVVTGGLLGAAIGYALFKGIQGYAGPDGAIASAAVVDLTDGSIVWFKMASVKDSRNILQLRLGLDLVLREL